MTHSTEDHLTTSYKWKLLDAVIIGAASIVIILLGLIAITYLSGANQQPIEATTKTPYTYVIALTALEGLGLFAGIYLFAILRRKLSLNDLGLFKTSPGWLKKAALAAVAMIPVISIVATSIQKILGMPIHNPQLEFLVPEDFSYLSAGVMLIVAGLIVPLAEELYFRGVLYQALRNQFGVWAGVIASSLVFGFLHGDVSIAGATFVMGLVLAFFFERSGSIWPSVLIHALNNSLKLTVIFIMLILGVDLEGF